LASLIMSEAPKRVISNQSSFSERIWSMLAVPNDEICVAVYIP
jgi:hypothetical protein